MGITNRLLRRKALLVCIPVFVVIVGVAAYLCFHTAKKESAKPINLQGLSVIGADQGGSITYKALTPAGGQTIPASGGTVKISNAQSPVNGLTIEVPGGAYAADTEFTVSCGTVTGLSILPGATAISPLIHVDNGGQIAKAAMTVTVPCKVPAGTSPLAFYYDPEKKSISAIPVLFYDNKSATLNVSHFSDIVMTVIVGQNIAENVSVETGFVPGVDDVSLPNDGTMLTPQGECSGHCLAALWYFNNWKSSHGALSGAYDNYSKNLEYTVKTPGFTNDDVMLRRLVSLVQYSIGESRYDISAYAHVYAPVIEKYKHTNDPLEYSQLAVYMKMFGPQMLCLFDKNFKYYGHAVIAYRIEGEKIYIADPNYPGMTNIYIVFRDGQFSPYITSENALGQETHETMEYGFFCFAPDFYTEYQDLIAKLWAQTEARTAGDSEFSHGNFELYTTVTDDQGNDKEEAVTDGYRALSDHLKITRISKPEGGVYRLELYIANGSGTITELYTGIPYDIPLKEGENHIGLLIKNADLKTGAISWQDFQWIKVIYKPITMDDLVGTYKAKSSPAGYYIAPELAEDAKGLDAVEAQTLAGTMSVQKISATSGVLTGSDGTGGDDVEQIPFSFADGKLSIAYDNPNTGFTGKGTLTAKFCAGRSVILSGVLRSYYTQLSESKLYIDRKYDAVKPAPPAL